MQRCLDAVLKRWHKTLGLSLQSPPSWYRDRLREELRERRSARTFLERLSETSDVYFSIIRARYDGFPIRNLPPFNFSRHSSVYAYMVAKYSLRWGFYRVTALLCRAPCRYSIREVVNPAKDSKLKEVASRHEVDQDKFIRIGRTLRRVWPLLP
ncbi:hypothetical protein D9758_019068 [Tetrapyrgos nigripes]|uniref:Uncharacterized protein n=1 Tax=Tetrapyrgos nigripes TaxID=182062 RepID=A0A8H5AR94_9AGAR|nr:hypothetical protein D9758_019068 [Tetrapyrgos nigripes]